MSTTYTLSRQTYAPTATLGLLVGPGIAGVYTCEDAVREPAGRPGTADHGALAAWVGAWKVRGQTAIPYGLYRLAWTPSPRLKRHTLRLLDVPGFDGILIHPGNKAEDSMGCILPGLAVDRAGLSVLRSRPACQRVEDAIVPRLEKNETVYLEIVKGSL